MAVAINPSSVEVRTSSKTRAVSRTSLAALIASMATIPMVYVLVVPVSQMMLTRGSTASWLDAFAAVLVVVAPATYALFCALTSDLTKKKISPSVRKSIIKVAVVGFLPYILIAGAGFATGVMALKVIGMLTVPAAIAYTVWFSSKLD